MSSTTLKRQIAKQKLDKIKTETELKQARAVISFMGDGLLLVDKHLKVILANEAAGVLLRKAPKELNGKKLSAVFRLVELGQKLPLNKLLKEKIIEGHDIIRFGVDKKIKCLNADSKPFPVSFTVSPFWTDDLTGLIIVFRDGTREQELEDSKDNFISITSHQLRTPLTTIRWNAEMLNDELDENTQRKEFAEQIYKGALRLNETVNLILSLSRSERGRAPDKIDVVSLAKLAGEVIENLKSSINPKKLEVDIHVSKGIADFVFPVGKLRVVLSNIVLNAASYTKSGGKIEISFRKNSRANEIICAVEDNGIGIPKDKQNKIFQKFFRAPNALRAMPDGSGLGLVLSKALVESWHGKIWFESKENKGTVFYFSIPLT